MIGFVVKKIIGSKNDRELKKIRPLVGRINAVEAEYQKLSDDQLRAKTDEFKARIQQQRKERGYDDLMAGARKLESDLRADEAKAERRKAFDVEQQILLDLMPEAFAVVKNACRRLVRHRKSSCASIRSNGK